MVGRVASGPNWNPAVSDRKADQAYDKVRQRAWRGVMGWKGDGRQWPRVCFQWSRRDRQRRRDMVRRIYVAGRLSIGLYALNTGLSNMSHVRGWESELDEVCYMIYVNIDKDVRDHWLRKWKERFGRVCWNRSELGKQVLYDMYWPQAYRDSRRYCSRGAFDVPLSGDKEKELMSAINSYTRCCSEELGGSKVMALDPTRLSLPPEGHVPIPLSRFIGEAESDRLQDVNNLLKDNWLEEVKRAKRFVRVKKGKYEEILNEYYKRNMVEFSKDEPKVTNGLFGTYKSDELDRCLDDDRKCNAAFKDAPYVRLSQPDLFTLMPECLRLVFGSDLKDYFHTIGVPESWRPYLGLPKAKKCLMEKLLPNYDWSGFGEYVYPLRTTCPQGFSWSVYLTQTIHETIIKELEKEYDGKDGRPLVVILRTPADIELARLHAENGVAVLVSLYVDDGNGFVLSTEMSEGECMKVAMEVQDRMLGLYRQAGLVVQPKKVYRPSKRQEVIGVDFDVDERTVGVSCEKVGVLDRMASRIVRVSEARIRKNGKTGLNVRRDFVESKLGKWVWVMMTCRPALSIWNFIYKDLQKSRKRRFVTLSEHSVFELWLSSALSPAFYAGFCDSDSQVMCFDASSSGYGVVYRNAPSEVLSDLSRATQVRGCYTALESEKEEKVRVNRVDGNEMNDKDVDEVDAAAEDDSSVINASETDEEELIVDETVDEIRMSSAGGVFGSDTFGGLPCLKRTSHAGRWLLEKDKWPNRREYVPRETLSGRVSRWGVARSGPWRRNEHVNVLEARAANMCLARCLRLVNRTSDGRRKTRYFVLGDSRVALGALSKGRSTAFQLLRQCRRSASLQLAGAFRAHFGWIDTHSNPSDGPSRWRRKESRVKDRNRKIARSMLKRDEGARGCGPWPHYYEYVRAKVRHQDVVRS